MYIQGAGKQIYLYTIMMLELFLLNQPVSAASATSYPLAGVVVLKTWPSCIWGKFTLHFGRNSKIEIIVMMDRWVGKNGVEQLQSERMNVRWGWESAAYREQERDESEGDKKGEKGCMEGGEVEG